MAYRKVKQKEVLQGMEYEIPCPLPPKNPVFEMDQELIFLCGEAMAQLGYYRGMLSQMHGSARFYKIFRIKEAIYSSEIKGYHASLKQTLIEDYSHQKPNRTALSILNNHRALAHAIEILYKQKLPFSNKIIRELQAILLHHAKAKTPIGQFRHDVEKVGNYLPPAASFVPYLMTELKKYINEEIETLPLIKIALAHAQFETILPFSDGNGRIGRQILLVMLMKEGLMPEPVISLSRYFKKTWAEYHACLDKVRTSGDFENWSKYFLVALSQSCVEASQLLIKILELENRFQIEIKQVFGKKSEQPLALLAYLFETPIIGIQEIAKKLDLSYNSACVLMKKMMDLNILLQTTTSKRNKIFEFTSYIALLERD